MNYPEYQQLFDRILGDTHPLPPYDNEHYLNYVRLNQTRMRRWDNHLGLDEHLVQKVKDLKKKQHWIILTEPWCGDAAHSIPFMMRLAQQNSLISYEFQLRDSAPFLIGSYLTNGKKSIPKLIARDENGKDLFVWGPRPRGAQELFNTLRATNVDPETGKIALQNWYNNDKGRSLCSELLEFYN
jgi:hypothetical protein